MRGFYIDYQKQIENDYEEYFAYSFTFGIDGHSIYRNVYLTKGEKSEKYIKSFAMENVGMFLRSYGNHILRMNRKLNKIKK